MNAAKSRLSETVDALAHSNQLLEVMMDDLRDHLGEPHDAEIARSIGILVDQMLKNLEKQQKLEVQADYQGDVLERFPTWYPHWEQLRDQSNLLHQQLRKTRDRLSQSGSAKVSREHRRALLNWLEAYRELRRREANLIHEAFVLDVGEGE